MDGDFLIEQDLCQKNRVVWVRRNLLVGTHVFNVAPMLETHSFLGLFVLQTWKCGPTNSTNLPSGPQVDKHGLALETKRNTFLRKRS